jgi:hypothetical protein
MQDASLAKRSIRLLDISHLLVTDNMPDVQAVYQCFSTDYYTWMNVPLQSKIKLNPDRRLFIRRVGIKGSDELTHLPQSAGPRTPPRLLRKVDTNGKGWAVDNSNDDDEVIIIDAPPPAPKPDFNPDRKGKGRALDDDDDDDDIIVLNYRPAPKEKRGATKRRRMSSPSSSPTFPFALLPPNPN